VSQEQNWVGQITDKKLKKKTRRKEDLMDLNAENCLDRLLPEDWTILFEVAEEFTRQG